GGLGVVPAPRTRFCFVDSEEPLCPRHRARARKHTRSLTICSTTAAARAILRKRARRTSIRSSARRYAIHSRPRIRRRRRNRRRPSQPEIPKASHEAPFNDEQRGPATAAARVFSWTLSATTAEQRAEHRCCQADIIDGELCDGIHGTHTQGSG